MKMTEALAEARYGEIKGGVWVREPFWCAGLRVPSGLETWTKTATGEPVAKIYCNTDMMKPLYTALTSVVVLGLASQLKTFDGCFNIRDIRGMPGVLSAHAYALALDINATENPLGGPSQLSPELIACFTGEGFTWGGGFTRPDPQHFSWLGW